MLIYSLIFLTQKPRSMVVEYNIDLKIYFFISADWRKVSSCSLVQNHKDKASKIFKLFDSH